MYFTVYRTINLINGKFYIGTHRTKNPYDSYIGSGVILKKAIEKYGRKNFCKEILFVYDNEKDMLIKEKELVTFSDISYNVSIGGIGGFDYINRNGLNLGANNVMVVNFNARQKCIESAKATRSLNPKKYADIARNNLKKVKNRWTEENKQKQAIIVSLKSKEYWKNNKEKMRDCLASTFEITDPNGNIYISNRLQDFCKEHKIPYVGIWKTSRTNKPIGQGRNKGWICKKI